MFKMPSFLLIAVMMIGFGTMTYAQDQPSAASLYNEALAKVKAEDFKGALPLFVKAMAVADTVADAEVIKLSKNNGALAAYKAGNAYRKEKKSDDALAAFDQGIAFSPNLYVNYVGRAQVLEDKKNNVEAVKAYMLAAEVAEKTKKADKAQELLAKAENFPAVSFGEKKWDEVIATGEAVLEKRESAETHYYMAQALKTKGQNDAAIEHAQKAIDTGTGDKSKYYFILAEAHEATGSKDKAIEAYKMVTDAKYVDRAKYKITELSKS